MSEHTIHSQEKNAIFDEVQRLDTILFTTQQILGIVIEQLNKHTIAPKREAIDAIACVVDMLYERNQRALYSDG